MMQALYPMPPSAADSPPGPSTFSQSSPLASGGRFNGQDVKLEMSTCEYVSGIWNYLTNANNGTPSTGLPVQAVQPDYFIDPGGNQLNATWLGHASLMINMDGYRLLTDPVFEKRVSLLGPTRFNGDVPLAIHQIPLIDVVIISHDHYDHLNKYSVQGLNEKTSCFVVPHGVGARLAKWGVPDNKIVELVWWEEYRFDDNLTITATPARHFSGRGLTDRNRTLCASWVIRSPYHKIFFSGDSGYFDGFKRIGDACGPFDMTFIECGAYNEAWSQVHMFPEQTVQAHLDLKGRVLHPIHWGTFNLALHPWYEPMERLTAAAKSAGVPVATPVAGQTTISPAHIPDSPWWRQAMANEAQPFTKR